MWGWGAGVCVCVGVGGGAGLRVSNSVKLWNLIVCGYPFSFGHSMRSVKHIYRRTFVRFAACFVVWGVSRLWGFGLGCLLFFFELCMIVFGSFR